MVDQSPEIVVINFDPLPVASTNSDPMVNASPVANSVDAPPSLFHEPDVGISVSTSANTWNIRFKVLQVLQ